MSPKFQVPSPKLKSSDMGLGILENKLRRQLNRPRAAVEIKRRKIRASESRNASAEEIIRLKVSV